MIQKSKNDVVIEEVVNVPHKILTDEVMLVKRMTFLHELI